MYKTFLKFALIGVVSLLSACTTNDYFYNDDSGMYSNPRPTSNNTPQHKKTSNSEPTASVSNKAAHTSGEVTKRVEPGSSTVSPSKTNSTNINQGPAVPNMAPAAVQ